MMTMGKLTFSNILQMILCDRLQCDQISTHLYDEAERTLLCESIILIV